MTDIKIYTDGSFNAMANRGGWAAKIISEVGQPKRLSGHEDDTTNNRMELTAALKALEIMPKNSEVILYSDSEYLVKTMQGKYRTKANLDLWEKLKKLDSVLRVKWEWIEAHAGHANNEEVDLLAKKEAEIKVSEKSVKDANAFSHIDQDGQARMVDVGWKDDTKREAVAMGLVNMSKECFALLKSGDIKKGDVLPIARVAGITGAKKTSELIPLVHVIHISHLEVDLELEESNNSVKIIATAKAESKTGVEMEALTAVMTAALTIYDMCKSVDKGMRIEGVRLLSKRGGMSGDVDAI